MVAIYTFLNMHAVLHHNKSIDSCIANLNIEFLLSIYQLLIGTGGNTQKAQPIKDAFP